MAHELGIDEDVVTQWSVKKLRNWVAYLQLKDDLQQEAEKLARDRAIRNAKNRGL